MVAARSRLLVAAAAALLLMLASAGRAAGEPGGDATPGPCGAAAEHPGGDWPSYGHDLANTRSQPLEDEIGPTAAVGLSAAWVFDASEHGGGEFNNTPIVSAGCVFLASSTGQVHALNADTGEVVWHVEVDTSPPGFGGGIVGTPAIHDDLVLVIVNRHGSPYIVAFEQATGDVAWETIIDEHGFTNASVVVTDGLVFAGHSGNREWDSTSQGGFVILDADTGDILVKTPTIPDEDFWERDYRGAGIWSTAAVDVETGHAYVGTTNPHSPSRQHARTNSLLKIDIDAERETFGEIVGAYRGLSDQYIDGLDRQPACALFGEDITYPYGSVPCLELDLDFGASPNLYTDAHGRTLVGNLQKAGVYHAVHTETMQRAWRTVVGAPCFACNAASPAFDGERLLVAAVPPGQVVALERDSGAPEWVGPLGDGLHYQSVSTANGVVYTVDGLGFLNGFDAETGAPVLKQPMLLDAGGVLVAPLSSGGVAIARNTVFAAAGGYVIAYRL